MDLELATVDDIARELLTRRIRFALVAIEDTNTLRTELACCSGKGASHQDVSGLFQIGRDVFEQVADEGDGSEPGEY